MCMNEIFHTFFFFFELYFSGLGNTLENSPSAYSPSGIINLLIIWVTLPVKKFVTSVSFVGHL